MRMSLHLVLLALTTERDAATGVPRAIRDIELGRKFEYYPGCSR